MSPSYLSQKLKTLNKILSNRIVRFFICGVITAAFNVILLDILIKFFRLNQENHAFFRNLANMASIEISLIFTFVVYRIWVWPSKNWNAQLILKRELPLFHLSCAIAIVMRSFLLFPLLDWMKVNYVINTLIGIAFGSIINYLISNKVVFNSTK